jgi:hypothetical protein
MSYERQIQKCIFEIMFDFKSIFSLLKFSFHQIFFDFCVFHDNIWMN